MTTAKTLVEEAEDWARERACDLLMTCPLDDLDELCINCRRIYWGAVRAYIAGAKRGHEKGWEDKDAITRKAVTLYEDEIVPKHATQADAMKEWEDGK